MPLCRALRARRPLCPAVVNPTARRWRARFCKKPAKIGQGSRTSAFPLLQGCCSRECYERVTRYIGKEDLAVYDTQIRRFLNDRVFLPFVFKQRLEIGHKIVEGYEQCMRAIDAAEAAVLGG